MRIINLFIVFLFVFTSSPLWADDVGDISGDWRIHTTSHKGYETWEVKIIAKDKRYNVFAVHQYLGYCEGELTLKGDEIKMIFTCKVPLSDNVQTFNFNGTVEGETMRGTKTTQGESTHGDDQPVAWVALKK